MKVEGVFVRRKILKQQLIILLFGSGRNASLLSFMKQKSMRRGIL